jgi:hypothetical protein
MPEQHPQQPFLFNEMSPPPEPEKPEIEESEKGEKKEEKEQFEILKNTGFTLTLKVESPIYFEKTYGFGKPIWIKSEKGMGNYMESPAYERLSKAMDEKAKNVFWDEGTKAARARFKKNEKRTKFLDGKFSKN